MAHYTVRPGDSVTFETANAPRALPPVVRSGRQYVTDLFVDSRGNGSLGLDKYHVFLFDDGTGSCQCQDFYYRGVVANDLEHECKHIAQAWRDQE